MTNQKEDLKQEIKRLKAEIKETYNPNFLEDKHEEIKDLKNLIFDLGQDYDLEKEIFEAEKTLRNHRKAIIEQIQSEL